MNRDYWTYPGRVIFGKGTQTCQRQHRFKHSAISISARYLAGDIRTSSSGMQGFPQTSVAHGTLYMHLIILGMKGFVAWFVTTS
ncbi:hypothetical protein BDW72DRAFT_179321 [Aspergillus terricola var. indicus]